MRILVVSPGERPSVREICGDLASMQAVTGGPIQALYPFEAPVALVCHEEGKLLGLPLNRALYDEETGAVYDVIAGTFFLCGAPPEAEDFTSLTEEQLRIPAGTQIGPDTPPDTDEETDDGHDGWKTALAVSAAVLLIAAVASLFVFLAKKEEEPGE